MNVVKKCAIIAGETVATCFLTKLLDVSTLISISLNIGTVFGIIVILASIVIFIISSFLRLKKESQENESKIKELSNKLSQKSDIKLQPDSNEGDRLLLMSLSQNLYEPLKISLLEKSIEEHNNVIAALMLGNLYHSGIEYLGKNVLPQDREKAFKIYMKISDADSYGVSEWELGWIYEHSLIESVKGLSDSERLAKAKEYYEKSANKGYPKAYNSLGNFASYGLGGIEKNIDKATEYYTIAAKSGDVYAIMNRGHLSMKRYNSSLKDDDLDLAESYFEKAASFNNAEGLLQLGMIYEIRAQKETAIKMDEHINKAKIYYIQSFSNVKNQYSATAYYNLGKLINNYDYLKCDRDIITALGTRKYDDLRIECFTRSYEIFQMISLSDEKLEGQYKKCFDELIAIFKNIK